MERSEVLSGGVLILEDDVLAAVLARTLIERFGMTADWTDSSANAIELLCRAKSEAGSELPVAIISDLNLSGGGAEQAIEWIRSDSEIGDLPILVISADDSPDAEARALGAGADCFMGESRFLRELPEWMEGSGVLLRFQRACLGQEDDAA